MHIKASNYAALQSQASRLEERRAAAAFDINISGIPITIEPGVYNTSGDSELMAECVNIDNTKTFLEVGCGSGVVSLALARRAACGVGVDINKRAVQNSQNNAARLQIENVQFFVSNVFENVRGTFDVIICNPPYSNHPVRDEIDRMFWDDGDEMKNTFFGRAEQHLNPNGRVYFGWADFADIDIHLPYRLAKQNGFQLLNTHKKPHLDLFNFYVFEFEKKIGD